MSVHIYVEGGGDQSRTLTECRKGFRLFFEKIVPTGSRPRVIACGSRKAAFEDFRAAIRHAGAGNSLLLVDSESPVNPRHGSWQHLKSVDGWTKPRGATDDEAHLMVQCMESWFLADVELLAEYYEQGFRRNSIPPNREIEQAPKRDVARGLRNATRRTQKGEYHKTRQGFEILSRLDPAKVRERSPHAGRLCRVLIEKVTG